MPNHLEDHRLADEAQFFDREAQEIIDSGKYKYSNSHNYESYFAHYKTLQCVADFLGDINGKRVLDLCCGTGWLSIYLARSGALVTGIDISPKSVEVANRFAEANEVAGNCEFLVRSGEETGFADEEFDIVLGTAALHHLKIDVAAREIARITKPGGKAAFVDDLRHHPVLWLYRMLSGDQHTENERPFVRKELEVFKQYFSKLELTSLHFLNLWPKSSFTRAVLDPIDSLILSIPPMKRIARNVIVKAVK